MQDRGFYTVEQAADTLDLTSGRIRQMLRGGDLKGSKEPGDRGWRITRESVEEVRPKRSCPRSSVSPTKRCPQTALGCLELGSVGRLLGRTSQNPVRAKFAQRVAPGKREIGATEGI